MNQIRIGMLTPSSNTVLEPALAVLAASMPGLGVHISRFRVTEISLSPTGLDQFAADPMVAAAELLADAEVDAIAWNGTSASWLGFSRDEDLCRRIKAATGVPATSASLAFREACQALGLTRIGLVTPYTTDVQNRICATWAGAGLPCTAERHLGLSHNFATAVKSVIASRTSEIWRPANGSFCEGFRMPAPARRRDWAGGRRPKTSRGRNRGIVGERCGRARTMGIWRSAPVRGAGPRLVST